MDHRHPNVAPRAADVNGAPQTPRGGDVQELSRITVDQMMSFRPCGTYSRDRVVELWAGQCVGRP